MKKHLRFLVVGIMMLTCSMSFAQAYKTLSFPDDRKEEVSSYEKEWTAKIGEDTWIIQNFNNNSYKNDWAFIKCGRKSNASVASVTTAFVMDKAIEKVVINFGALKNADKINSIKLRVCSDLTCVTADEEIDVTKEAGEQIVTISSPAQNKVYQLVCDCEAAGTNGIIQLNSIAYYEKGSSVDEPAVPAIPAAKGDGTLENPFNCTAANLKALELASGEKSATTYYIKGKVASIKSAFSTQFGNVSLYLSEDGTEVGQFYVYRALYLENKKWNGEEPNVKAGDEIIVNGYLTNYNGTPETAQNDAYIYSINGQTKPNAPAVDISNTPETAYSVKKAIELIAAGEGLASEVYVQGVVTEVTEVSAQFGNATFNIGDAADGEALKAFRLKYLENSAFTEATADVLKVGDKVILKGKLVNYSGSNQIGNGYIYSHNGLTTGISVVNSEKQSSGKVYNLSGQEVDKNYKGLVIINGKVIRK